MWKLPPNTFRFFLVVVRISQWIESTQIANHKKGFCYNKSIEMVRLAVKPLESENC